MTKIERILMVTNNEIEDYEITGIDESYLMTKEELIMDDSEILTNEDLKGFDEEIISHCTSIYYSEDEYLLFYALEDAKSDKVLLLLTDETVQDLIFKKLVEVK